MPETPKTQDTVRLKMSAADSHKVETRLQEVSVNGPSA